jgi:16S rRNA processing protein RimM
VKSSERFAPAPPEGDELEFGEIVGVFGVHGDVRLHLHHRESTLLNSGLEVILVDPSGQRWLTTIRTREGAGKRVIGRLSTSLTREEASGLKGWRVRVRTADLPPLEPGEFWVWQVLGARVWVGDEVVGRVREVHATGPVEVFEVSVPGSSDPVFVPAIEEHVAEVVPGRLTLHPAGWPGSD